MLELRFTLPLGTFETSVNTSLSLQPAAKPRLRCHTCCFGPDSYQKGVSGVGPKLQYPSVVLHGMSTKHVITSPLTPPMPAYSTQSIQPRVEGRQYCAMCNRKLRGHYSVQWAVEVWGVGTRACFAPLRLGTHSPYSARFGFAGALL